MQIYHTGVEDLKEDICEEEVSSAIKNSKKKSAPGSDGISYGIIKQLPIQIIPVITNIYNKFLKQGIIPSSWSDYIVSLIPKPGGIGYRPIAMSNGFLKILEKIINNRLTWWSEKERILPQNFLGFRTNKSCNDNIGLLVTDINSGYLRNKYISVLFLDIAGAYDNVVPSILINDLIELDIPYNIVCLIKNLMQYRKLHVEFKGSMIKQLETGRGLPQGSILSPLLFNLYMRKMHQFIGQRSRFLSFADDKVIFNVSDSYEEAIAETNISIKLFNDWLESRGLSLSKEKTKVMLFTKKDISREEINIVTLNGTEIEEVDSTRFLGMILSKDLKWTKHIDHIAVKAKRYISVIKAISGLNVGAHPSTLLTIYKGLVRATLDWGSMFYHDGTAKDLLRIDRIQYAALRCSLGCIITTPINVLLHLASEPPLVHRRVYLMKKYLARTIANASNLLVPKLTLMKEVSEKNPGRGVTYKHALFRIWLNNMDCWEGIETSQIPCRYQYSYDINLQKVKVDLTSGIILKKSKEVQKDFNKILNTNYTEYKIIYTDGSKKDERTGAAVWCPDLDFVKKIRLHSYNTIYYAELTAIKEAILFMRESDIRFGLIVTDSKSSMVALSGDTSHKYDSLLYEVKYQIRELEDIGVEIKLLWVPSHKGIEGNETVDEYAKEALMEPINEELYYQCTELNEKFKKELLFSSYLYVKNRGREKGVNYFKAQEKFPDKCWFNNISLTRAQITIINRIRSNHTLLRKHLFDKNIVESPDCLCGKAEMSTDHIIWECNIIPTSDRIKLFSTISKLNIQIDSNIQKIFLEKPLSIIMIFVKFLLNQKEIIV